MRIHRLVLLCAWFVPLAGWPAAAAVLHVGPSGAPYTSIQAAVDDAAAGDVVKIAAGTYSDLDVRPAPAGYAGPANVTQVVFVDKDVFLVGGYDAAFTEPPDPAANPTVIDPAGLGRGVFVAGGAWAYLSRLTIRRGDAAGLAGTIWGDDAGGGVFVHQSPAVLEECIIADSAAGCGGGAFFFSCDPISVEGSTIQDCTADAGSGGGLYLHTSAGSVAGCALVNNSALEFGGGLWSAYQAPQIVANTLLGNQAHLGGGGAALYDSFGLFEANLVRSNTAATGGGLWCSLGGASLRRNLIVGNFAHDGGGGIYLEDEEADFENTVIGFNQLTSPGSAGAGLLAEGGLPSFRHTTVAANTGGDGAGIHVRDSLLGGAGALSLLNTILAQQAIGLFADAGNAATLGHTVWFDNTWGYGGAGTITIGVSNFVGDPQFIDPSFHVGAASVAIDHGVGAGLATDMDGEPRPAGAGFDIGADEYWAAPPAPTPTPGPGVTLDLPAMVHPGETFFVSGLLSNLGPLMPGVPVVFFLEVYGEYWFWPSWSYFAPPATGAIDYAELPIPRGASVIELVPAFSWPDTGMESASGLRFYGAMLTPAMDAILGEHAVETWGYGPA